MVNGKSIDLDRKYTEKEILAGLGDVSLRFLRVYDSEGKCHNLRTVQISDLIDLVDSEDQLKLSKSFS